MALDVYSGGLSIEPLRESIGKLSMENRRLVCFLLYIH